MTTCYIYFSTASGTIKSLVRCLIIRPTESKIHVAMDYNNMVSSCMVIWLLLAGNICGATYHLGSLYWNADTRPFQLGKDTGTAVFMWTRYNGKLRAFRKVIFEEVSNA